MYWMNDNYDRITMIPWS